MSERIRERARSVWTAIPIGLIVALSTGLAFSVAARPSGALASRPNFVLVQTDDQTMASAFARYRTATGRSRPVMPKLRKFLGRGGFNFHQATTAAPLCAPSRASLLTGQYPHNTDLFRNDGPNGGWNAWQSLPIRKQNLAVALDKGGYRTIHVGKFLNSYRGRKGRGVETRRPPGWDRWTALTDRFSTGRDRTPYYRYRLNDQGRRTGPFGSREAEGSGCVFDVFSRRSGGSPCAHFTDRTTLIATRELRKTKGSRRPFFMAVSYTAPHGKTVEDGESADPRGGPEPSARHRGSASGTPLPRPASFNEADISDKPRFVRRAAKRLRRGQVREVAGHYRAYLESLRGVDDGIGKMIGALRRTGKLRNTFFLFTSDNGLLFGQHRFEPSKFLPYQEVVRVPLLIRGPGVPRGGRSRALVSLIDVAPTIAELARVDLGYEADGRSLRPLWRNPSRRTARPVLFEVGSVPALRRRLPFRGSRALRVGPWKIALYRGGATELYNVRSDPHELRNLARRPGYAELKDHLRDALAEYAQCSGVQCQRELVVPDELVPQTR